MAVKPAPILLSYLRGYHESCHYRCRDCWIHCSLLFIKEAQIDVTVYDHGVGRATKAAAGIISPWFSKRRNKAWYRLARLGADFYQELVEDLAKDGIKTDFYPDRVYLLKKKEEKLDELYQLALSRREESPLIGELAVLTKEEVGQQFPGLQGFEQLPLCHGWGPCREPF